MQGGIIDHQGLLAGQEVLVAAMRGMKPAGVGFMLEDGLKGRQRLKEDRRVVASQAFVSLLVPFVACSCQHLPEHFLKIVG
jgi:hypothetical protein